MLTFYRKELFDFEATYAEPNLLPGGIKPWVTSLDTAILERLKE
jgi:heat shock protein 4